MPAINMMMSQPVQQQNMNIIQSTARFDFCSAGSKVTQSQLNQPNISALRSKTTSKNHALASAAGILRDPEICEAAEGILNIHSQDYSNGGIPLSGRAEERAVEAVTQLLTEQMESRQEGPRASVKNSNMNRGMSRKL